jgi:hypothetical protein
VQVALGRTKEQWPTPLSAEEDAFWDRVAAEVAEIVEAGGELEMIPIDLPEPPPWVTQAPEAT